MLSCDSLAPTLSSLLPFLWLQLEILCYPSFYNCCFVAVPQGTRQYDEWYGGGLRLNMGPFTEVVGNWAAHRELSSCGATVREVTLCTNWGGEVGSTRVHIAAA